MQFRVPFKLSLVIGLFLFSAIAVVWGQAICMKDCPLDPMCEATECPKGSGARIEDMPCGTWVKNEHTTWKCQPGTKKAICNVIDSYWCATIKLCEWKPLLLFGWDCQKANKEVAIPGQNGNTQWIYGNAVDCR